MTSSNFTTVTATQPSFLLQPYFERIKPDRPLNALSSCWKMAHSHSTHPGMQANITLPDPHSPAASNEVTEAHMELALGSYRLGIHNLSTGNIWDVCVIGILMGTMYKLSHLVLNASSPVAVCVGASPFLSGLVLSGAFLLPTGELFAVLRRRGQTSSTAATAAAHSSSGL